ncbi:MAG TPA: threonine ammonia-lyase, biosynthetic [Opitutales bacterium]|nr:threonine ammonia-lyase, biosynthetic [Opitutales bacterium]
MKEELVQEILMARQRVYAAAQPTPLEQVSISSVEAEIFLKREDLSPINSYKWRGAFNRMALLSSEERQRGVIAASAGNHAQGVALAAQKLRTHAKIFMPVSTPRMKQVAVQLHGGDAVEIRLIGDTYDEASAAAHAAAESEGGIFVHPYDDLATMGGQGTLADEIVMSGKGPFDVAYLQIGGGGMAGAVACWLRTYWPEMRIVGVEGKDQASMKAAIESGKPTTLDYVDVFCDGTAVSRAGDLTYPLCRDLLDEIITVTNEEVSGAIQVLWETSRCIPEPSGAMGLAGLLKERKKLKGKRVLAIVCGANVDFAQLGLIARHAGSGTARRRYLRFELDETPGAMLRLLQEYLGGLNITEFQYGKVDMKWAWPVIGIDIRKADFESLERKLQEAGIPFADVTNQEDVEFRIIHYRGRMMSQPFFFKLEFPERPGALHDFLLGVQPAANICYFNYIYTGERVGRALMGFEFEGEKERRQFQEVLRKSGYAHSEIQPEALSRILSRPTDMF